MTMKATLSLILAAVALPSVALADASVIALTPAEIEAAKEDGARQHANSAIVDSLPTRDRAIHGEVGFAIGTGGYGAIYGTAVAPLGDNGEIAISIANEQYGRSRRWR